MKIAYKLSELQSELSSLDRTNLGFVPTMGALHDGHLALIERARRDSSSVVVTIFVNPTQFNDPKDLKRYPRTPEEDLQRLEKAGVDLVFMPSVEEIYPEPDKREFDLGDLTKVMEGATRPGHFNGVAQVVSRLFDLIKPQRAYFGEKDFQQIVVIKALVALLKLDIEIVSCPTVREADGLAMSSRNHLLEPKYRAVAPTIYSVLSETAETIEWYLKEEDSYILGNGMAPSEVEQRVIKQIERDSDGLLEVIYFDLVDALSLEKAEIWDNPNGIIGCVAVKAGGVRLIDNIKFV